MRKNQACIRNWKALPSKRARYDRLKGCEAAVRKRSPKVVAC
jgi:hypothetical protein